MSSQGEDGPWSISAAPINKILKLQTTFSSTASELQVMVGVCHGSLTNPSKVSCLVGKALLQVSGTRCGIPWLIWSLMWPLYLLFNKFLKTEEENAHEADEYPKGLVESYSLEQLPSNGKCPNVNLPHSHFVEVPHMNQLSTWDCGLACVLMVLRTFGINNCNIQALEELCCTTSIWTVDLAYLLQKFSVSFSYFTVTLGANPNFSVETFYKDQLATDLVRVDSLFKKAMEAGIDIQCRSISGDEISLLILSGKYIAIALIDQYKLSQSWLENVHVSGFCGGYSEYTVIILLVVFMRESVQLLANS
ncbi:Protein GUCD1 [Vitis vinifera]|uniref:Protein GUCD1 n=1 Tax=Vitis vinifera TaxID=29760 RepID=A0A438JXD8_VITVI|nr:Protein GUCD1 [Vitis vinifera]